MASKIKIFIFIDLKTEIYWNLSEQSSVSITHLRDIIICFSGSNTIACL